jgi:hypothetical protein
LFPVLSENKNVKTGNFPVKRTYIVVRPEKKAGREDEES